MINILFHSVFAFLPLSFFISLYISGNHNMRNWLKGYIYRLIIDPLLAGVRASVIGKAGHSLKVIDIACGPGTLALDLARIEAEVTAIDLDEDLVYCASQRAAKRGIKNIHFEARNAADLTFYRDKQFDVAVTSMSVHQFESQLAIRILQEMKRIANKVIIADYNYPLPQNFSGRVAKGIERLAGGDHYYNFRNYIGSGGLKYFTDKAGLEVSSSGTNGNGVFVIAVCV
jgi:SAM-dependent methyltransferase